MGSLVTFISVAFFSYGLWQHDWRLLVGSFFLAIIGPLLAAEAREARAARRHRELVARLWNDDDLSDSA